MNFAGKHYKLNTYYSSGYNNQSKVSRVDDICVSEHVHPSEVKQT